MEQKNSGKSISLVTELKNKVLEGETITRADALELFKQPLKELAEAADEIRRYFCGNDFDLCSIINAKSGQCSENCKFCSQSSHFRTGSQEYAVLQNQEILEEGRYNSSKGVLRYSLVTSGKRLTENELSDVCSSYENLRDNCQISLCASHGLLEYDDFIKLKEAGVQRYHNNLETSRRFFPQICTTHTYDDKLQAIKDAQRAGLEICSGGIMGLGETIEDRIDMSLDIRSMGIRSIPVNVLNPVKGTPFEANVALSEDEILKTIAVYRFLMPDAAIRLAGGRGLLEDKGRNAFQGGANAAITGDMLTTAGISIDNDLEIITASGYKIKKL
ncbi:MAG: biotin synthase BioB [Proteocatella sp.]